MRCKPFDHTGFRIAASRKMMNVFSFHQVLKRLVVEFFPIIHLKIERFSPFTPLQYLRHGIRHRLSPSCSWRVPPTRVWKTHPPPSRDNDTRDYTWQCYSLQSNRAVHCSSIPYTITGRVGNRRRLGLCKVYLKSRWRTSRARRMVMLFALANRVTPPRLPGLSGSRYLDNRVFVDSSFFFFPFFFITLPV